MIVLSVITSFAATESAESAGIGALGIDFWAILAQGVTFLILLFLIKKFALDKVVKTLEARRTTVETSLDKAEAVQKQNEQAEQRTASLLKEARKEAEDIISKSHEEAGSIVQAAEDNAGEKAAKIIADGEVRIQAEVEKAQKALKQETLALVSQATEILLEEKVDAKKNEALIKKALGESRNE